MQKENKKKILGTVPKKLQFIETFWDCPEFSKKELKDSKGITLIALIITIIVMLILVGVSVTVALRGGLFSSAQSAKAQTQEERDKEQNLAGGKVEIGGVWYNSIEEYTNGKSSGGGTVPATYKESIEGLAEGVTLVAYNNLETEASAEIKAAVDAGKVQAVLKQTVTEDEVTTTYTAVVPTGFEISTTDGEDSIAGGLVIKDGLNEFVWIPYTSETTYAETSLGPPSYYQEMTTQEDLDYYYGKDYYDYSEVDYLQEKTDIETSINKYKGFYVGRYETTIDGNTIGTMANKEVLTTAHTLRPGNNEEEGYSGEPYYYRWFGLYKVQKDMYGQDEAVFSTMITENEWELIINFSGYEDGTRAIDTYVNANAPDLSGGAYKDNADVYDVSKNIYDLAGNVREWTLAKCVMGSYLMVYGGSYSSSKLSAGDGNALKSVCEYSREYRITLLCLYKIESMDYKEFCKMRV